MEVISLKISAHLPIMLISYTIRTRGRAVAARGAHNPEVGGSNPPPATNGGIVALSGN
jgi:hypothetical protein